EAGLVLVDMHAAHERILMERLKRALDAGNVSRQRLLVPAVLAADALDLATAEENRETFERLGLEVAASGPNELTVRAAPALLASGDIAALTRSLLQEIRDYGASAMLAARQNELLATMACHAAVRAHSVLSVTEMNALLRHGRSRQAFHARTVMAGVMLITGGSRGIGAATARLAAERGYKVGINYVRDRNAAETLARETGGVAIAADVAQEAEVVRMFGEVDRRLGRLEVLVNNAGVVDLSMRVDEMSAARITRMFAINVTGSFLCAREALKRMSTRHGGKGGAIVNISSVAARIGAPGMYVDYAAAKAAIDTFTLGLSKEVGGEGVRVNAVRPGVVRTEIHASGGDPGRAERIGAGAPLGRAGEAEEIARAILWLAGDEASYVSGAILDVAGGR
ncbi:MAG: SDR family oxidoreductase, partial [Betaproteobacteria bacterium]